MKTVLIADDQPSLRLLINATIASDDYNIVEAADGDQAWRLLQEHRPEIAVLDVIMPGKSGIDLTKAIRQSDALAATRVILLSACETAEDVARGLAAGADLYMTKPFSPLQLLGVLK
jgi:DNA-binding response OmpR family regulator